MIVVLRRRMTASTTATQLRLSEIVVDPHFPHVRSSGGYCLARADSRSPLSRKANVALAASRHSAGTINRTPPSIRDIGQFAVT